MAVSSAGLWGWHRGDILEGPGEHGSLVSQEPPPTLGVGRRRSCSVLACSATLPPASQSVSLSVSRSWGLPLPWAQSPYCLNFSEKPCLRLYILTSLVSVPSVPCVPP